MWPILFETRFVTLHTYGFFLALAFLVGVLTARRLAKQAGLEAGVVNQITDLSILVAFSSLIGAKVLMVITEWSYYSRNVREIFALSFWRAGGVFYGGLIFALAAGLFYVRRYRLSLATFVDVAAPGIALGHAIGRLGCFSAGCCYGKATSLPWAVTFTNPYSHELAGTPLGVSLHPSQLYEVFTNLVIFSILLRVFKRRRFPGQIFAVYLALYGVARFLLEFLRGDPERGFLFGTTLSTSQGISLLGLAASFAIFLTQRGKPIHVSRRDSVSSR